MINESKKLVADLQLETFTQFEDRVLGLISRENDLRGAAMLTAISVLLNVATFGSEPLHEDGSETPNRLMQLKAAKFLHSLHSDKDFEAEYEWLLNQIQLHPRYAGQPLTASRHNAMYRAKPAL